MYFFLLLMLTMTFGSFSSKLTNNQIKRPNYFRSFSSYKIRVATINDVPFIRNCNIKNLPENYKDEFYIDQLRKWPRLSLLCEDAEDNVVGYALGRVLFKNRKQLFTATNNAGQKTPTTSYIMTEKELAKNENNVYGHVLSIAVSQEHRGKKIAKELMDFMHIQFASSYDVDSIDLYCRVSFFYATSLNS